MSPYRFEKVSSCSYRLNIYGVHSNIIYNFICELVPYSVIDSCCVTLSCASIVPLNEYLSSRQHKLSISECIKLIDNISKAFKYLEKNDLGYYGLDLDDILVIDDAYYLICNSERLMCIRKEMLQINCLIENCEFSNPEIVSLTELPATIGLKSVYYSIGLLVIFVLLNRKVAIGSDIEKTIKVLCGSKLYWFIKRCVVSSSDKRMLLLI